MSEQLSLFDTAGTEQTLPEIKRQENSKRKDSPSEVEFFIKLRNNFAQILLQNNAPTTAVTFNELGNGIYSCKYREGILFYIKLGPKAHWMQLPLYLKRFYADFGIFPTQEELDSETTSMTKIILPSNDPAQAEYYRDMLNNLLDAVIDTYPKDFSCCSRYVECSDAKICIHPDPYSAMNCSYRVNLKKGKIYYGKNSIIEGN